MANQAQRTFAGGEISPSFYAHTDLTKYAQSLRRCRNFIVQAHGGVANRPGTEYIGNLLDQLRGGWLVPWVFNDEQAYALEFTDHQIRIIQDGEYLSAISAPAWSALASYTPGDIVSDTGGWYYNYVAADPNVLLRPGTGSEWQSRWKLMDGVELQFPSPYAVEDLSKLQWVQSADVMTLACEGYPVYELRRLGALKWVLAPVAFGPLIPTPGSLALSGGVAGGGTWYAVTAVSAEGDEESIPASLKIASIVPAAATPVHVSWAPVTGALEYNIYRSTDGTTFGLIAVVGGTPTLYTDTTWTTGSAVANAVVANVLVVSGSQARNPTVTVLGEKASDGKYRVLGSHLLTESGGSGVQTTGRVKLYFKRNTDAVRQLLYTTPDLVLYGAGSNYAPIDQTFDIVDDGYTTLEFDLVPEVISGTGFVTASDTVTGTSIIYTRPQLSYDDFNVLPDYTQGPPTQSILFNTTATRPAVVGQAQQRRFFANTPDQPEMAWGSRTALPANFSISTPLEDTDSISWRLAGRKVNEVRHLVELGALLQFTSGGVFMVDGDQAGILKPDAVTPKRISAHGASDLSPVEIGESALLYVQTKGVKVRALTQSQQGFGGQDLTLLAAHLFKGHTIIDWAYCEEPDSVLWCVRDDGILIGLTYLAEQEIYGWHWHDTLGTVENVCAVPEGSRDALYLIVKRTINGAPKRYVERLSPRTILDVTDAIFMDAAISFDGTNTTTKTLSMFSVNVVGVGLVQHLRSSAPVFDVLDVGTEFRFTYAGVPHIFTVTQFVNNREVIGVYDDETYDPGRVSVSVGTTWAQAVPVIGGLGHLEGMTVSVLGDGSVVGSPYNDDYPTLVVSRGQLKLPQPHAKVHIGLPYLADLETLDIDRSAGPSMKETAMLINKVGLYVEESRGGFFGGAPAPDDDPLAGLYELKERVNEPYDTPIALQTGDREIGIANGWNKNGRVFLRQVDPLPLAVLAIWPSGYIPG